MRANLDITLRPLLEYDDKERTHVYGINGNNDVSYIGGEWNDDNSVSFKTRAFGSYTIQSDSLPPYYKPLIINKDRLVFRVHDRKSGIKSMEVHVNGEWVLMNYDPKIRQIWSEKKTEDQEFIGDLTFVVTDNAGNQSVYERTITK